MSTQVGKGAAAGAYLTWSTSQVSTGGSSWKAVQEAAVRKQPAPTPYSPPAALHPAAVQQSIRQTS
jgi:hypothetical protein